MTDKNGWQSERYSVTLRLLQPMLGTVPCSNIWASHIAKKQEAAMKKDGWEDDAIKQELEDTIDGLADIDAIEQGKTTFMKDEKGYYIRNYMIHGFLKHAASVMKQYGAMKQLKSKMSKYVFVETNKIYLAEPDAKLDVVSRPLRAQTPLGERVCISRSDAIPEGTQFTFVVESLENVFSEKLLLVLFDYGRRQGLGQWRSSTHGAFEVVSCEKV